MIQRFKRGEDERDKMSQLGLTDREGPFLSEWRDTDEEEER